MRTLTTAAVALLLISGTAIAHPVVNSAGWDKFTKLTCFDVVHIASDFNQTDSSEVFSAKSEFDSRITDEDEKVDYDPDLNADQMELQHRHFQVVKQSIDTSFNQLIDLAGRGQQPDFVALAGQECKSEMQGLRSQYVH